MSRCPVKLWVVLAIALASGQAVADARPVPFPLAGSSVKERADAILTVNACGRDLDYLNIRAAMAGGDLGGQGEGLTSILIAKIEWLRSGQRFPDACETTIQFPRGEVATWSQSASPTRCAVEKSRVDDGVNVTVAVSVSSDCMWRQVNEALRAMRKEGRLGSSKLPCVSIFRGTTEGEWDTNTRELVRILYMGRNVTLSNRKPLLEPATIEAMYENVLAARGPLGPAAYDVMVGCGDAGDELGSPEDSADRHDWGVELLDGIADVFKWLFEFLVRNAVRSVQLAGASAIWPFMVATGNDPTALFVEGPTIPETENHRLQIESSRYLTNLDLIERVQEGGYGHVDELREENAEVREWLLRRLQDIAAHDFLEYNSKPYTRYSLESLANLYDFGDDELKMGAHIVLDLSGAKFAVGSNRGRRVVPYRRTVEHEGITPGKPQFHLYNYQSGADHEVARALVLSGQTQLLEVTRQEVVNGEQRSVRRAELARDGIQALVDTAVSTYRLPQVVLELAAHRAQPFSQRVVHGGFEQYEQSLAFTVSAGGIHTPSPYSTLGFALGNDEGLAMPTVIIPTIAGLEVGDLFAFYGEADAAERPPNLCVWKGFACGVRPVLPALFAACQTSGPGAIKFYNSKECFPNLTGPHFYLVVDVRECTGIPCKPGTQWGLMEIVEAPAAVAQNDPAYALFREARASAFAASQLDATGSGLYVAANGERIGYRFDLLSRAAKVVTVNDTAVELTGEGGKRAGGDPLRTSPITSDGRGRASIASPTGAASVDVDFSSWPHPKRTPP